MKFRAKSVWRKRARLKWRRGVEGKKSKDRGKWKKMLHHDCNKKEAQRRRAIRPAAVIHFHLNPWTLNDFPWVETACQRCVRVSVYVRERQKEKVSVSTLTSAVQTPHFTASAPLSIAPCSLYAPSLSLHFASTQPPPHCVTKAAIYSSRVSLTTLISPCLPAAFVLAFR